jgi:glycosyltransferase involved in cell wall biosynthesis
LVEVKGAGMGLEKAAVVEGRPFVVVGVPAFNEEKTIAKVVIEAQRYADRVVVCDDGSTDLTAEIAECLGADVVRHERNLGYGAAIRCLFGRARELGADVFVTLDADGQHDPGECPAYAMPWYRRAGVKFITRLVSNSGKHAVRDAQSGFRAYSRKAIEKLIMFEDGMGVSVEILVNAKKQGLRIQEVSAKCNYSKDVKNFTHNPIRHGVSVVMSIVRLVVEERPLLFLGMPGLFRY